MIANAGVTTATVSDTITFNNPCVEDFTLTATGQGTTTSDKFTGTNIAFSITPFTITPDFCPVTYSCAGVTLVGGGTSTVSCSDITINADGSVSFSADNGDYTSETILPGQYQVAITGTPTEATDPAASAETAAPYVYTLVDPCLDVTIVSTDLQANHDLTITEAGRPYTSATLFDISLDYCVKDSTMTLPEIAGLSDVISYNSETQQFTLSQITDSLALLDGQLEKTFTITMDYAAKTVDGTDVATETKTFTLTLKNPCVDTDYVNIVAPDLATLAYTISTPKEVFTAHPSFTIATTPTTHTLCGDLTIVPKYEGADVTSTS